MASKVFSQNIKIVMVNLTFDLSGFKMQSLHNCIKLDICVKLCHLLSQKHDLSPTHIYSVSPRVQVNSFAKFPHGIPEIYPVHEDGRAENLKMYRLWPRLSSEYRHKINSENRRLLLSTMRSKSSRY